ncbi:transglycosylase domain-containing protein [Thalassobacillus sp. B23F22_16]|uniref:transglycosylase domain-containing protein n=1 Tax=Thalassobacillus sp. B23F22_16 TaxID=3459513 RepID=UPI00373E8D2B
MKLWNNNDRPTTRMKRLKKKRYKWAAIVALSAVILAVLGYLTILFGGMLVADKEKLVLNDATTVELENGEVIERIYTENRTLISMDEIPDHVEEAFMAVEDARFYEHGGVDPRAIFRAVYKDLIAMKKVEGGSTITMQLAKNLFLTNDKTFMRKTKEVMAALYLERNYTKKEILELYLNRIYFGKGIYGVEQASQVFYNKPASELTISEGAMLAGMPKAPNTYSPVDNPEEAVKRRNVVLDRMHSVGMITSEQLLQLQGKTLEVNYQEREDQKWSNSYVDLVIREAASRYNISRDELKRGGYRIITGMDPDIQKIAYEEMQNGEYAPGSVEGVQGAFTLMDADSGAIVAAIGGRDYEHGTMNRANVRRAPGSTIKPLSVYGPAMMEAGYDPYSLLVDRPMKFGNYEPKNYDGNYEGLVSLYDALVKSKNVPAVWLLDQIGIKTSKEYLKKLGLETNDSGLSLALGGLEHGYSPVEMVEAYRAFARGGKSFDAYAIKKIEDRNGEVIEEMEPKERTVFSEQVAWNMTEMLQRVVSHGTGTSGSYGKALAGKTGTQQHDSVSGKNKDVWFAGYTPEYVGSLWMGYDSSGKDHYLEGGSSYPTAMMKAILTKVDQQKGLSASFQQPEGVEEDVAPPVKLPAIDDLNVKFEVGGSSLIRGRLSWTPGEDDRIVYHIYKEEPGVDTRVGEVKGDGAFTVEIKNVFKRHTYYVVPYDPYTKMEGQQSNRAVLEW